MLNLRNVPKEKVEEKKPREITKLAIGKEGGAEGDQPEFDVVSTLICVACDIELDKTNPLVAGLIDSVILSKSAYFESQVGEWELDLKTCPHTENLVQEDVKALESKALAHCQKCDLRQNLWLCMTCGSLGCGRKQWDGSGGNEHGIEHFKEKNHPVVCKIGTITPEGNASVHCYLCDDDVLDNKLGEHLAHLGLDIA